MRIEKIELNGFKSFAEKTVFNLHPGVTCLVGPNGSGKSNVVDSFRWVLGEQSAKSLRSGKMEEVIFDGSATKKPKGMSEVNLMVSFDSQEQGNGEARSLTAISRRLYRSGESEYYINKTQSRLKDIRDILLDTGLEVRSYSILAQGQISEILNAKPVERRFLIEEVAGVMKYKVRRAEALSKLESSKLNIQRVNDIITEVKRQINALDRQVRKAERFKKLSAERGDIELRLARRDYLLLKESMDKILAACSLLRENEALAKAGIGSLENDMEISRIGLLDKEKHLETLNAELQGIEREIAEKEREIAVSNTENNNLTEYLTKLSQQETDLVQKIIAAGNRKEELDALAINLKAEIDKLGQELVQRKDFISTMENNLSGKEKLIEAKRKEVFRIAEDMSHLKNDMGKLLTSIENLEKKNIAALNGAGTAKNCLAELEKNIKEAEAGLAGRSNALLLLNEKKGKLNADLDACRTRLDEIRGTLSRAREDFASAASRLDSLREIMFEESSGEILSERENLRILASIAEVIDVDAAYEKAVENALSEKVNGFILSSFDDIAGALSVLKQKKIGRTVFIPLDLISGQANEGAGLSVASGHDSIIGRAFDLLRVQPDRGQFAPAIKALLSNIIVVKDLSAAASLFMTNKGFTFVTLDGEILEPSGTVIAGEDKGVLKREREIRELAALTEKKKTEIGHLERTHADMDASIQENMVALKDMEADLIHAEKEFSLLKLTTENQTEEKERASKNLTYLHIELEEIAKEEASLKGAVAAREAEIEGIILKKTEAEQMITGVQGDIAADKEQYEAERIVITDLRLSINTLAERIESVRKDADSSVEMLAGLSGTKTLLLEEKANIESRILQCAEDIAINRDSLKGLVLRADSLKTVIAQSREIFRNESEGLISLEQETKALRKNLDFLTAKIAESDISITEHRLRLENLSEGVRRDYGIEIDSLQAEPVTAEEEEHLSEIKAKIQELGPVNLGSLEEYEELKTRHEFLAKQQDDLNKSVAELEEAITKINSTTRKKLRDAFEQLSIKFSEVFAILFGGGRAELLLTDENNILESGIEIIAQPPGKRLQNINLLSGGEKTLTALSVLFAGFLIKPSPLCVMDEVDSALDDANIERFAKMLRELSKNIQFIVVTHNRITMESADYIYGITTEEPGVSKVISMQLAEA